MKTRNILYAITLVAYSLWLAHSVVPHHHHKTAEEADAHHHGHSHGHTHDDDHESKRHSHHEDSNSSEQNSQTGHFFLFSHDSNAEVLVNHSSASETLKAKKAQKTIFVNERKSQFSFSAYLVFHPPPDREAYTQPLFSSTSLRAPPSLAV
jgi:hypothetical protein